MIALLLVGCTTTVRFPPDLWGNDWVDTWRFDSGNDSGPGTPPPTVDPQDLGTVDEASLGCDPGETVWLADVKTVGWTDQAVLYVGDAVAAPEEHGLLLTDSDPQGAWDEYQGGPLTAGVDPLDFEARVNSTYRCDQATEISAAVVLYDRFGDLSDCLVWGAMPTELGAQIDAAISSVSVTCREAAP